MIKADYHVHTNFSSDSTASLESMIEQGIALGLERICITDHMDYDFPKQYKGPFVFDPEEYFAALTKAKETYQDQIKVLIGIECGLRPYLAKQYEQLIHRYPFDFVICSSHLVGDIDPYYKEYWENASEQEGIRRYLESIVANIKAFNDFDVYGHLDYVVRYGPTKNKNYHYEDYKEVFDEILLALIRSGKGIEVNTAGYKYGLGMAHPQADVIRRYKELGGTILTIGSDGHKPEHLGYAFETARELLLSLGVKEYTVFEKRIPIQLPL